MTNNYKRIEQKARIYISKKKTEYMDVELKKEWGLKSDSEKHKIKNKTYSFRYLAVSLQEILTFNGS